ncbi:MAG: site-specific integrase [Desulfobacteraceae bacterium]|nr:MAG: site-specific integrase [Desulfobacteraceae bacterium]
MAKVTRVEGKKGVSYRIDYFDPNGKRVRKMFKKKKDADAELGKRVSLIAEGRYLDVKEDCKTTLKELLDKYEENFKHQSHYQRSKRYSFKNFKEYIGSEDVLLSSIRYVDLETYYNHLRNKPTKHGTIRKQGSTNREIAAIHHLFVKALEWDMIEKSPFEGKKALCGKENNERVRYLLKDEIRRLLDECKHMPYLRRIVVCAINSGMRKGEILSLRWKQVRNGIIRLEKTKTLNKRNIPINEDLAQVFKDIRAEQGLSSKHVFTRNGKVIKRLDVGYNAAVKRAGIEDFTFHDLRHTFASHLVMK